MINTESYRKSSNLKQETHKMRLYIPPNDANDFHTLREEMIAEETIANLVKFAIFSSVIPGKSSH